MSQHIANKMLLLKDVRKTKSVPGRRRDNKRFFQHIHAQGLSQLTPALSSDHHIQEMAMGNFRLFGAAMWPLKPAVVRLAILIDDLIASTENRGW